MNFIVSPYYEVIIYLSKTKLLKSGITQLLNVKLNNPPDSESICDLVY